MSMSGCADRAAARRRPHTSCFGTTRNSIPSNAARSGWPVKFTRRRYESSSPLAGSGRRPVRSRTRQIQHHKRAAAVAVSRRSASSASDAPARMAKRKSDSSRANRQLRICPSAVRRTRLQSPQNGRVTEPMMPTVWGPSSTRNFSAGADPRPSMGVSLKCWPSRVSVAKQHRIDVDRLKPGRTGGAKSGDDVGKPVAAGDALEP